MAQRVNLDAMIRREDFSREVLGESAPHVIRELSLSQLLPNSTIRRQLRKPDFQRETNHWSPEQVLKFLKSFIDGDVIPSIILWRSTNFVFVIDGAHRLSALCAWIENDYGDRTTSNNFYASEISKEQKRIANRTRTLIEEQIGSYSSLDALVGKSSDDLASRRAGSMATRPIYLQSVIGNAKQAEDSFFAINTQGTPLDDTETHLIKNRRKSVAIGARAIARAGRGHAYWSSFSPELQSQLTDIADKLHKIVFEPELSSPIKTLELPLGGSSSPVDALSVLVEFLTISNNLSTTQIEGVLTDPDDENGELTIKVLMGGLKIAKRITGNTSESLGLHPAVYFTNDKGKHSRFLFLGMVSLIAEKLRNNDNGWFRKFTLSRKFVENFLVSNKSVIGIILQNLNRKSRIPKMRDMIEFLVADFSQGRTPNQVDVFKHLDLRSKVYEVTAMHQETSFNDETKSQIFFRHALQSAQKCPICEGLLDAGKSVSYDHIIPVRDGGLGLAENGQMVHPFCNSGMKS